MDDSLALKGDSTSFQSCCTENLRMEKEELKDLPRQFDLDLSTTRSGLTCCIFGCFNSSKKDKTLSYYRIPMDKTLRTAWLTDVGYVHGRKTAYMNNTQLVVPKKLMATQSKR